LKIDRSLFLFSQRALESAKAAPHAAPHL